MNKMSSIIIAITIMFYEWQQQASKKKLKTESPANHQINYNPTLSSI